MIDLERFRAGSHEYFEEIVRTHGPMVLVISRAFGKDADHAEDLFQEVWRRAFEKRGSFSGRGSFEAWLHRLATNVCIGDYRARRTRTEALDQMKGPSWEGELGWRPSDPLSEAERSELQSKLHRALAHLSERELQAICLRILEGKTPDEVAEIMGVEKSTVRSNIRHGISHLRELMEGSDDELSGHQPAH